MPSAKIAHLLLVHQKPGQVARLVKRLYHSNSVIFIHVDKKANLSDFTESIPPAAHIRYIKKRESIRWGAFSMVRATLSSFKEIINYDKHFDFIDLRSGADYVLKPINEIHDYLSKHKGRSFIAFEYPNSPWLVEAHKRVNTYQLIDYDFKGKYFLQKLVNRITKRRDVPMDMELSGGSQWFTMSIDHVKYCLAFVTRNPAFVRFFKHTWIPDELFFHTILVNSVYSESIVNDNHLYVDWSENKFNPKVLTSANFEHLIASNKWYARKFDITVDESLLDKLDDQINNLL